MGNRQSQKIWKNIIMSPMRFPRVSIIENGVTITKGYLNKDMPQGDDSYLYEIYGDNGVTYILTENDFIYIDEDNYGSEW